MPGDYILVLGATGPTGICLVRELLRRQLKIIVYARNPSKLPEDLSSSTLIKIKKGEMDDLEALAASVAQSRLIVSLLGPTIATPLPETTFSDMYRKLFVLMRENGVRRIFAMGTPSIYRDDDHTSFARWGAIRALRLFYPSAYKNIISIQAAFEDESATDGIDWTVYRIGQLVGESDQKSWEADREDGQTYVGPVAGDGWTFSQKRAALARWLADAAESDASEMIGSMPAVSRMAGS